MPAIFTKVSGDFGNSGFGFARVFARKLLILRSGKAIPVVPYIVPERRCGARGRTLRYPGGGPRCSVRRDRRCAPLRQRRDLPHAPSWCGSDAALGGEGAPCAP